MLTIPRNIKEGTWIKVNGINDFIQIEQILPEHNRKLFKLKGYAASWQWGHVTKFSNKSEKPKLK